MSIQDIQANPQSTSNFYLANIQQALTHPNPSNLSLSSSPPPFSPPTYGIWVNSLWFLSLVISMTCAVLANLLQQWARKYIKVTRPRSTASERKQARYHAFYAEGVESFLLPWVFEALPAMLHLSVFLFFAGLVVFLWNFDPTISKLILSWVAGCVVLYGYITFIPIFRHDSPYHTPLSPLAWSIVAGIPFLTFRVLEWIAYLLNIVLRIISQIFFCICPCFGCLCCPCLFCLWCCLDFPDIPFPRRFSIDLNSLAEAADRYRKNLVQGLQKTAENAALEMQSAPVGLSRRALMWTFDSLHEDDELERFFSSLPGFRGSNDDEDILPSLTEGQKENLWSGLIGFLDRTFSSNSLLEPVKKRRAKICADALDPTAFPYILDSVISEDKYGPVRSAEIARFVGRWGTDRNIATPTLMQPIVSSVVASAQSRNDYWFTIASDELGVGESVLRDHATHDRHDLSLAILIHVTCQQLNNFKLSSWPTDKFSKVLRAASKFKVQQTSPELQRGFCALWNHIVQKAQHDEDDGPKIAQYILRPIYKVYIDMHQRTHAAPRTRRLFARTGDFADILRNPPEYPSCDREDHHLDLTPPDHDESTLITFTHIAALVQSTSGTSTPAVPPVTTAPRASPAMTPTRGPRAAAEGDGKPKPDLCRELDAIDPPSVKRTTLASMLNPQSSSRPSATNSNRAIADRSRGPNAGRTGGDRPPHVSHCWYDIV